MFDIEKVLSSLSFKRPIFHSEADFQHALAWEIKEHYPTCDIRLETKIHGKDKKVYLDLLVIYQDKKYAVELKYKTRALNQRVHEEDFLLNHQGAHDIGRYDVLKDFQRVEQMIISGAVDKGYVIFLTNDSSYYKPPSFDRNTVDKQFRIHLGQKVSGQLNWDENTGEGTMRGRENTINLIGEYDMKWSTYSKVNDFNDGLFRYICAPIDINSNNNNLVNYDNLKNNNNLDASFENADWFNSFKEKQVIPNSQRGLRDKLVKHLRSIGYLVKTDFPMHGEKIDIWAESNNNKILIEVRFKTSLLKTIYNGNEIHLKNQGAQDVSRYDFIKDLKKLEEVTQTYTDYKGYALLITNNHLYWRLSSKLDPVDKDYHIHEGRLLTGTCSWGEKASKGTTNNREESIKLEGQYHIGWQDYLSLGAGKNEQFKVLLIEIN